MKWKKKLLVIITNHWEVNIYNEILYFIKTKYENKSVPKKMKTTKWLQNDAIIRMRCDIYDEYFFVFEI